MNRTVAACFALLIALGAAKLAFFHRAVAGEAHPLGIVWGGVCIALMWSALLPVRRRWWIAAWGVQTIWLLVNWSYALYFSAPLWFGTIIGAGSAGALAIGHGAIPLSLGMLWLLADLPALLAVILVREEPAPRKVGLIAAGSLATVIIALSAWAWWRLPLHESDPERIHPVSELVARIGPMPVQLGDALRGSGPEPAAGPAVEIRPDLPGGGRRSVLIVQVESMDAATFDRVMVDGKALMPNLASRAAGGTCWPWSLAYHGPGGSSDGEFAAVQGCEPNWHAPVINRRGYTFPHALPQLMAPQGWDCHMMLGLFGSFFDYGRIQPRVGYRWHGIEELGLVQHVGMFGDEFGARDLEFVDAVASRIPALPDRTLLHCTTMTSHIPWLQWHDIESCAGESLSVPGTADDYARCLRYTDRAIERLVSAFLARFPDGVVVLYGDHTGCIDADGYASPTGKRDGVKWEFVPIIVLGRDVPARRVDIAGSQLDVQRTILAAAGWSGSAPSWGMDLIDPRAAATPLRFHGRMYDRAEIGAWAKTLGRRLARPPWR